MKEDEFKQLLASEGNKALVFKGRDLGQDITISFSLPKSGMYLNVAHQPWRTPGIYDDNDACSICCNCGEITSWGVNDPEVNMDLPGVRDVKWFVSCTSDDYAQSIFAFT